MSEKKKRSRKAVREIPNTFINESLQILRNYCISNYGNCEKCRLQMPNNGCVFGDKDFPERFKEWKDLNESN